MLCRFQGSPVSVRAKAGAAAGRPTRSFVTSEQNLSSFAGTEEGLVSPLWLQNTCFRAFGSHKIYIHIYIWRFFVRERQNQPLTTMNKKQESATVSEVEEHVTLKYDIKKRLGKGVSNFIPLDFSGFTRIWVYLYHVVLPTAQTTNNYRRHV